MSDTSRPANRLIRETSPYLLQHARNPVDWYPWGPEALERARREERPIFLSIGYSACHWCHVMEHESFEDAETAAIMNEHFVCIKVDREERPDLDHIYMAAVQMMTKHGGWPMSVFLTPDLEPFYGGTYFPPEPKFGMPSFRQILLGLADAWNNRRGECSRSAGQIAGALIQMNEVTSTGGEPTLELVDAAVRMLERAYDPGHGGFGSAPKFPHPMDLKVCLRHWKRTGAAESLEMVTRTLDCMARGGIYDHLGGGFHRYSTDERWLVPHFEKMLYDNALLTQVYLEAFQATGRADFARVARETLDYVLREMTSPDGGFYCTQDADSEGVEGKFFVWSLAELRKVLGGSSSTAVDHFAYVYDVSAEGNWEDHNILNRPKTMEQCAKLLDVDAEELERSLPASRAKLLDVRSRRIAPGRDDKVLVSWNGLMIDAMARGYQLLEDERYLDAARRAAEFILTRMRGEPPFMLLHSFKDGRVRFNAYLDDYANLIHALISLYESDFEPRWLAAALELADVMRDQFWDDASGTFFFTGRDHEALVARPRDSHDSSTPSGNSMAATALARLGRITGRGEFTTLAERTLKSFAALMASSPMGAGQMLVALDFALNHPTEIVLVPGEAAESIDELAAALRLVRSRFRPSAVVICCPASLDTRAEALRLIAPLGNRPAIGGEFTVYVCQSSSCLPPITRLSELEQISGKL